MARGSEARLAIMVFPHRLLQDIGAMAAGEHDDALLAELKAALAWLGAVPIRRIPADEEGQMARLCLSASRPA